MNLWLPAIMSLVAGLLSAGGAFLGVRLTVRGTDRATNQRALASRRDIAQRELAASREEWWRRFTWAAELTLDDEARTKRTAGLQLLTKLAQSDLAGHDEWVLLDVFQQRVLDTPDDEADDSEDDYDGETAS